MDRGAWWATAHEVAESQTRLSDYSNDNSAMLLADMAKLCHEQAEGGHEAPRHPWGMFTQLLLVAGWGPVFPNGPAYASPASESSVLAAGNGVWYYEVSVCVLSAGQHPCESPLLLWVSCNKCSSLEPGGASEGHFPLSAQQRVLSKSMNDTKAIKISPKLYGRSHCH